MPLPSEWYENHLVIEDQKEANDEFLVDALYLTKANTLACKAGNKICFETKGVGAMEEHRERLHPFLEQRFPVGIWRDLLPPSFCQKIKESMEVPPTECSASTSRRQSQPTQVPVDQIGEAQSSVYQEYSTSRKESGGGADNRRTKSAECPESLAVLIKGILKPQEGRKSRVGAPVKVVRFLIPDTNSSSTDCITVPTTTDQKSVKIDRMELGRAETAAGGKKKNNKKMTCSEDLRRFGRNSTVRGTKLVAMGPLKVYSKTKTEIMNEVVDREVEHAFNGRSEYCFSIGSHERDNQDREGTVKKSRGRRAAKSKL